MWNVPGQAREASAILFSLLKKMSCTFSSMKKYEGCKFKFSFNRYHTFISSHDIIKYLFQHESSFTTELIRFIIHQENRPSGNYVQHVKKHRCDLIPSSSNNISAWCFVSSPCQCVLRCPCPCLWRHFYFTTSKVERRLDIMTGHSPFSSYSANSPLDKSTFSNLVPSSYKSKPCNN